MVKGYTLPMTVVGCGWTRQNIPGNLCNYIKRFTASYCSLITLRVCIVVKIIMLNQF